MTLPTIISDRTKDGITIVEFLVAVMQNELDGFKPCHRLQAARLLTRYGCACKSAVAERGEAFDFILDNLPEPSRQWSDSGSSDDSEFDTKLAKVIQESTDDGRSVCRFLINVMEGELRAFGPHQRIAAARELLSRGFGRHARDTRCTHSQVISRTDSPIPGVHQSHESQFRCSRRRDRPRRSRHSAAD